jgi:hypothetical protein
VPVGQWTDHGLGIAGSAGVPVCTGSGTARPGSILRLDLRNARPNSAAALVLGLSRIDLPLFGGVLVPRADLAVHLTTTGTGTASIAYPFPPMVILPRPIAGFWQYWISDPHAPRGLAASNGVSTLLRQ